MITFILRFSRHRRRSPTTPHAPRITIDVAATQEDVERACRLLSEQIRHPSPVPFPTAPIERHDGLHAELIVARCDNAIQGAAFIGPDVQEAEYFALMSNDHARRIVIEHVAMVHAIAVDPSWRRRGIGLSLKLACDAWAADHGADLVVSVPTTQAARHLNDKAGHVVLDPGQILVLKIQGEPRPTGFPLTNGSWAFALTTSTRPPKIIPGRAHSPSPTGHGQIEFFHRLDS